MYKYMYVCVYIYIYIYILERERERCYYSVLYYTILYHIVEPKSAGEVAPEVRVTLTTTLPEAVLGLD